MPVAWTRVITVFFDDVLCQCLVVGGSGYQGEFIVEAAKVQPCNHRVMALLYQELP
jgi:hypothetical protein